MDNTDHDLRIASHLAASLSEAQIDIDISRVECERSYRDFMLEAWPYIDSAEYVHGWYIDAICEHLEAVARGQISNLVINIPPRCAKSTFVSVGFPAWIWSQPPLSKICGPATSFMCGCHSLSLARRDRKKCRDLILSDWYQDRWGNHFDLPVRSGVNRFQNSWLGEQITVSRSSGTIGEGADIMIIDDPHNPTDAESDAERQNTIDWFDHTLSTRFNDPNNHAMILVMQRLFKEDLTGHILDMNPPGLCHLMLPMEYVPTTFVNTIGWSDPREYQGDLLCPERFNQDSVDVLKKLLGSWGASGQLQQNPVPKGGGLLKEEYWKFWDLSEFPQLSYIVGSLDSAFTAKEENDPSAFTIWGVFQDGKYGEPKVILLHAWQEFLELPQLVKKVQEDCKRFLVDTVIVEAKASGLSVVQEIKRQMRHGSFSIRTIDPKGDKYARAASVVPIFEAGLIYRTDKSWADMVVQQCSDFPKGSRDDLVDSTTQAIKFLREQNFLLTQEDKYAERMLKMRHVGQTSRYKPLRTL